WLWALKNNGPISCITFPEEIFLPLITLTVKGISFTLKVDAPKSIKNARFTFDSSNKCKLSPIVRVFVGNLGDSLLEVGSLERFCLHSNSLLSHHTAFDIASFNDVGPSRLNAGLVPWISFHILLAAVLDLSISPKVASNFFIKASKSSSSSDHFSNKVANQARADPVSKLPRSPTCVRSSW
ncbi:6927_t:CDS:2, partial [Cetraspora pellucida]